MTNHFRFDELTWPDVANLERTTPLVLPLGEGFSNLELERKLGSPAAIGWLPAIPYGWKGSCLEFPAPILKKIISDILAAYGQDGFQSLYVLLAGAIKVGVGKQEIHLHVKQNEQISERLEKTEGVVLLVPFGHTEQHALHLPLSTDTICIDAICHGVVERIPGQAAMLPTFPYGVSTHRSSFAGTTSINGRTFEDLCLVIADVMIGRGFQMLYYVSGHGGNVSFLVNAIKYLGDQHPNVFSATTWLYLNGPKGQESLNRYRQSGIGGMGHACELETSLLLHLKPGLVHMDRVVDETKFISTPSYYQDWIEGGVLIANPPWKDDTVTGAYGAGSLATAGKGKIWLETAIEEKVDHVLEIKEQHRRRTEKRRKIT
jgi:creatinine amidohydrolase